MISASRNIPKFHDIQVLRPDDDAGCEALAREVEQRGGHIGAGYAEVMATPLTAADLIGVPDYWRKIILRPIDPCLVAKVRRQARKYGWISDAEPDVPLRALGADTTKPIPDAQVEAARNVTLKEAAHLIGANLRRAGQEFVGPCPFCGGDDRFSINPAKHLWNCRRGANGADNVGGSDAIGLYCHAMGLDQHNRDEVLRKAIMRGKFIAYYRVSTEKQGKSSLGLAAQRKAVADYLDGGDWTLIAEFMEVESGKHNDRPELEKALQACKKHKARLIIAKLDRLSRNLAFIATLMDRKVDFVCCDNPTATKFTLHILAAVAEHERDAISARTKAALAAAKAKGTVLGNSKRIAAAKQRATTTRAESLRPVMTEFASLSTRAAADALNRRGIKTASGGSWFPMQLHRMRQRLGL